MDPTRLAYLYKQYLAQRLTESEREEWQSVVLDAAYSNAIQQLMETDWINEDEATGSNLRDDEKQEQIYRLIVSQKQLVRKGGRLRRLLPYAAAVCAVITAFWLSEKTNHTAQSPRHIVQTTIMPGGNKAVLTLPDGRAVDLSTDHSGIIMAGNQINYLNGEQVVTQTSNSGSLPAMLTLTTPKGGTYQLTLPDGSNVWLNAGSVLKYPGQFDKQNRTVELTGEAYFKVAEDADRPFRVVTDGQYIEVLGTQFNVTAYKSEPATKTTLVEGSVRITNTSDGRGNMLKPGQQSVVTNDGTQILEVATLQFTAWKDGYFRFESTPFPEVLEQLARWYDIAIVYRQKPTKKFSGTMKRDVQLASILHFFENSGIKSRIEGRKLIIY